MGRNRKINQQGKKQTELKNKEKTKPVVPVTIEAKADTDTKIVTKTCYRINKYPVEMPWKKHITEDMIYNSGYELIGDDCEISRFNTLEEAQVEFEAEKENCVRDDFKGSAGWLYCTYVLELEEIKIEIDEDGDEEIVDGDFLDYFTVPYDLPEDDDDEDEEEDDE